MEWSYGACDDGCGLFWCEPKKCEMHNYRQTIDLGTVKLSKEDVEKLLDDLSSKWMGYEYDLLRKNCCHFSDEFAKELGVGPIPGWIVNLAGLGARLEDQITKVE